MKYLIFSSHPLKSRWTSSFVDQVVRDEADARGAGHSGVVRSVAFSPDPRLLASASWDKTASKRPTAQAHSTLHKQSTNRKPCGYSIDSSEFTLKDKDIDFDECLFGRETLP